VAQGLLDDLKDESEERTSSSQTEKSAEAIPELGLEKNPALPKSSTAAENDAPPVPDGADDARSDDAPLAVEGDSSPAEGSDNDAPLLPLTPPRSGESEKLSVYVIPITDAISAPNQFIFRRGAKEALENDVDVLLLEIDTPGGSGAVMIEIMENLADFQGDTIAFVNDEAISAGAFISFAADQIWYKPGSLIGAAEVVAGDGSDIPESLKRKLDSYFQGKIRSIGDDHPHRADVMRAMTDPKFVFERDGKVLKDEGELLTLTAEEALETYGRPPLALFGDGIADSVEDVLDQRYGADVYSITQFEISWAEEIAKFIESVAPILLTIATFALILEFNTPGFGVFGISAIALFTVIFGGQYVSGLTGYEPMILFFVAVILIALEIFLLPGTLILAFTGFALLLGSLVWALADVWPSQVDPLGITVNPDSIWNALGIVTGAIFVAFGLVAAIWRFLPKLPFYSTLILTEGAASEVLVTSQGADEAHSRLPDLGSEGMAVFPLHPVGKVEIGGDRYEATVAVGTIDRGERIVVVGYRNYSLLVEKAGPSSFS
jgi:membrane-bound serine protease (ClpP class)